MRGSVFICTPLAKHGWHVAYINGHSSGTISMWTMKPSLSDALAELRGIIGDNKNAFAHFSAIVYAIANNATPDEFSHMAGLVLQYKIIPLPSMAFWPLVC